MFPCTACGECCKRAGQIPAAVALGLPLPSGVCRYYDKRSRLCTIYARRPHICRIDAQAPYREDERDAYYRENAARCNTMIEMAGLPKKYIVRVRA